MGRISTWNYSVKTATSTGSKFNKFLVLFLFAIMFASFSVSAQDAYITAGGAATTICEGESTTFQVIIGASSSPYTVVYSDGTSDSDPISGYDSDADPESPGFGGDLITVSPTETTTYTLVSVTDQWDNSLPISSASFTITVNPLPTDLSVSPSTRQCPGVNFEISASATNGNTYELWNAANTSKTADLPYTTSITSNTNYTVRAISEHGCTISQAYAVLLENTPPTISTPANQTLNPGAGTCSASIPDYTSLVTVSDNCTAKGSIALSQSPAVGASISGHNTEQTITITATDEALNVNSCNFTVTLLDNISPYISCVGNQIVPAGSSCTYTHSGTGWDPQVGTDATDNCSVASVTFAANNGASPATGTSLNNVEFQPGTTTVTWTVTDGAGNTDDCIFTVSIEDDEKPTVTCPGNQTANTDAGNCTYEQNTADWDVTADDNCTVASIAYTLTGATTGTVNTTLNGAVFNKGVTTVTVLVSDGAATPNTETCNFTVTISDNENPTLTCPSNISVNNDADNCDALVIIPDITFGDNCTGATLAWSTTGATEISGSGQPGEQTFNVGVTTVTLTVTDAASRTAQCNFTVTVSDTQLPTISCPTDIAQDNDNGFCTAAVVIPNITYNDNCSGSSIAWTTTGATEISGSGQPGTQTFDVGITTVSLTVTDASLNTANCSFTVTITDAENPTVTCPANITQDTDAGVNTAEIAIDNAVFGDNCAGSTLAWTMTGVTTGSGDGQIGTHTFNYGTTTIEYTVTDAADIPKTNTCSFTVTIEDNEAPVIASCPANIDRTCASGSCSAQVYWTEPNATDNKTAVANLVWTKSHTP